MDARRGKERIVKSIMGRYTREQLKKEFGLKSPVVDGFQDMLDLNKLIKRITPEQIKALKEKQLNGNYGVQDNATMRDVLLQSSKLVKDFKELPAILREKFSNDEFVYHDFLQKNKNNKYALAELHKEITGSKQMEHLINQAKAEEELAKQQEVEKASILAEQLAKALNTQPK